MMSNSYSKNYNKARLEMCIATLYETSNIADQLDYYCEATGKPTPYTQMILAFATRLDENLFDVGSNSYRSLASQQCCGRIYTAMAEKLLGLQDDITEYATNRNDKYILKGFTRTIKEVLETQKKFDLFEQRFAAEIAAEQQSDSYVNDKAMIDKTLNELGGAISGKWTSECVEVTDSSGTRRPAELPGSSRLSQIAKATSQERGQLLALQL